MNLSPEYSGFQIITVLLFYVFLLSLSVLTNKYGQMLKAPTLIHQTYISRYYNVIVGPMMTISVRYAPFWDLSWNTEEIDDTNKAKKKNYYFLSGQEDPCRNDSHQG